MTRILCLTPTFALETPEAAQRLIDAGAELHRVDVADAKALREEIPSAFGIIVGTQPIGHEVLSRASSLRVVAKHGTGVDNIDLVAAAELGILVTNAPQANATAVAEYALGLMFAVSRGIVSGDRGIRDGGWRISIGRQLAGSTLGVLGLGSIGRLLASRASALGMVVIAHDILPAASVERVEMVEFPDLLRRSDFLSLHVPLTPETAGLLNAEALSLMKPTAHLINTARGGLVVEDDLVDALTRGRLAGAALDVFADEPLTAKALLEVDGLVLSPHTAAYTTDALANASLAVTENVLAVMRGEQPPDLVSMAASP
jgi:D-3-phosphoglycerate dehydrogenase / 2-oxoglutarate reductase